MIVIGIDIGLTGSAAALNGNLARVADLPTTESSAGRRLHGRGLIHLLREFGPAAESAIVVIEDVRPRAFGNRGVGKTNSMNSQASMMGSRRIVEAVCDIGGWRMVVVQPQTWKRAFGLIGKDKEASRQCALRLFPDAAEMLRRKKDHNRADSLLLARYGQLQFS